MTDIVTFEEEQFNRIFPFYILINSDLGVESVGKTMEKIYPGTEGKAFVESFQIVLPDTPEQTLASYQELTNQMIVIICKNKESMKLRGQLEWVEKSNKFLFMGTPWFESVEQVVENKLSFSDFAHHDPMIDLLHLLKTQEIATDDLKHLLNTVSKQKDDLKKAAKEIEDIALFPTQNPDPLIRIDFEGNVLTQNPTADKLTHFDYKDIHYTAQEFWKLISKDLDMQRDRIIIESGSKGEIYSFVIKPIPASGYYNIYGRKVTEQKKNEDRLQILSSIAAQNTHGVVIADKEGRIEWVNASFEEMTGFSLEEIKGEKPGKLLQGPESDPETVEYLSGQLKKGEPFSCEILNYNREKKPYWLRIQGQALRDKDGNITNYFAIEEDITKEREDQNKIREFEKRFKMALEEVGDYVWEHNFATGYTHFSKKENPFLGINIDETDNIIQVWSDHILEEDRHILDENLENYQSGKADSHVLEYRIRHKDGSVRWVMDRGVVMEKDAEGKPTLSLGTHTDITSQKNLELELADTATRLTSLIKNLYSGVLLEDENRRIALVNEKFCQLFKIPVSPEVLIGSGCSDAAEQSKHLFKNPDEFVKRISEILEEKKLVVNEHVEMADGIHLQRDFIPIRSQGMYKGHLWLYTDITEQIEVDRKLDEQRTFYEQILNNTPADIAVFDNQHKYLYVNPQAISDPEMRSWLVGKKDEDYAELKNIPYSSFEKRRELFNRTVKTRRLQSFEEEIQKNDGSIKYILRNFHPVLNNAGNVELVVGYGIDITPIKEIQLKIEESEKRYRDVFEHSLALISTHDMEGKFITVNNMVGKTYGYDNNEIIGHSVADFLPQSDRKLFLNRYLKKIKEKKQDSGIFRAVSKDGKIIYTYYNNFLREEPGREPYVIGFAVDITDRIKAEKELKKAKRATEELAEAKQSFLTNMSHEIRTPMNAIIGMSDQLVKTELSPQQKFYLNTIHTSAENLLVIINDILDLSKIEAGKLTVEEIAFEPKKVVENAKQVMMHKAEEKGIRLTNSFCDSDISEVLIGDPYRLNQVLLNLISNAVKFTETGSVDLQCEVVENNDDSQLIRATVIDTGIGMDTDFLKNPFQKFTQEDASISRRFGGTGLGMTITRSLIELMGGDMTVASKKNEGTKVSFELLLKKGNKDQLVKKESFKVDTNQLIDRKILIVDDNEINRLVAYTILDNYGTKLIEAENGREAIELIYEKKPDIVLMDIQMPILNGVEATIELREKGNNIPIIALTANAIKGENQKCFDAGMNDYISKPYKENELLYKVVKLLDKKEITEEQANLLQDKRKETKEKKESKGLYDLGGLEEISHGNEAFISKMIKMFCDLTPGIVNEMVTAFHNNDYKKMGALAHKMKPSIDNLRVNSIAQDIRTVEKAGKEDRGGEEIETLLVKIDNTIQSVVEEIKNNELN